MRCLMYLNSVIRTRSVIPAVLGTAVMLMMILVVKVTLHQHQYITLNQFSYPPSSVPLSGSVEGNVTVSAVNSDVNATESSQDNSSSLWEEHGFYQKDVLQELNNTWTEERRKKWLKVLRKRQNLMKEACLRNKLKLGGTEAPDASAVAPKALFWVASHDFVYCAVFKAASTTWAKNLLVMSNGGKQTEETMRVYLRNLYPPPDSTLKQRRILQRSMRMIVVRHPFERLLSAYRDKMLKVKPTYTDNYIIEQQKIARSYSDDKEEPIPYTDEEMKRVSRGTNGTLSDSLVHPTFTQFLMKVRDDLKKLKRNNKAPINLHWRPVWSVCAPCHLHYTVIAHVETLDQDQEFIIRELGLDDVIKPAHTHASRFDGYYDTSEAAKDYFRKVPLDLMQTLTSLLQLDFELFGYSPSKYLNLAGLGNSTATG